MALNDDPIESPAVSAIERLLVPERVQGTGVGGVHGRIVHGIGSAIVSGAIKQGERLPTDPELIERFQASRTAIREAMKVLSAKGLIEARQRAGTRVRPRHDWDLFDADVLSWHSPDTIGEKLANDLVELRELIEPVSARLAASRATDEDIERMEEAYRQMAAGVDQLEEFYAGDVAFHLAVLAACHNQLMQRLDAIIGTVLGLSFELQKDTLVGPHEGLEAHYLIIDRIRARDRRGAERAMRAVIGRAKDEIDRREEWPRLRAATG